MCKFSEKRFASTFGVEDVSILNRKVTIISEMPRPITKLCSVKAKKTVNSNWFLLITYSPKIKAVVSFLHYDTNAQPIYWRDCHIYIFLNFQNCRAFGQDLGVWSLLNISNSILESSFFNTGYSSGFVMEKHLKWCLQLWHKARV